MQLRADQLEAQLAGSPARANTSLAAVYTIHGDEPLLALEAADLVRGAARREGCTEREVFEPGRAFDWSEFAHASASQSLFGARKLIELRLASGKPSTQAAQALIAYCGRPNPDAVLLVTMPRPDAPGWWKSEWFNALDAAGVIVEAQPVARGQLPAWISQRLARQGRRASREVLEFLADRVEGNLLAAHQEVQKLALLAPEGELTMQTVQEAVASVARYDPYAAAEALVAGKTPRYARIIEGLRGEGEQPTFVLFVLASVLFVLRDAQKGAALDPLFARHRLFNKPLQRAVHAAAKRYPAAALARALSHAAAIDRAIKGVGQGEPWEEFIRLGLTLSLGPAGST